MQTKLRMYKKPRLLAFFAFVCAVVFSAIVVPSIARADCGPVILDPGHGGNDTGAIGWGLQEKDLTWKITNYCKERLDELGIPNVLTRGENDNPSLTDRANMIDTYNARALVSFHINSASGESGTGSEVWVPHDSNYNEFTYQETAAFGNDVLNRFEAMGLLNRGLKTRTIANTSYPDGSNQDYLAINRLARLKNTSGVLIEHAFINNPNDAKLLADDAFLRELGYNDAEAIAAQWPNSYVKPTPDADYTPGWKHDDNGWWWRNDDGSYPTNAWVWLGSSWYHFNEAGYMNTGWFWDNGWYWLGGADDGAMAHGGWTWCDWAWYYLDGSGHPYQNTWFWDGVWYLLNPGGDMAVGWHWVGDAWYYFFSNGYMATYWFMDGEAWYYADGSGSVWHWGWAWINGAWYYLNANCMMHTGWLSDYYWYFMDYDSGAMRYGWVWANDNYYFLDGAGHMLSGWYNDGWTWYWLGVSGNMAMKGAAYTTSGFNLFDESGSWVTGDGWHYIDGSWYYLVGWEVQTGWLNTGGSWYFLYDSGAAATGEQDIFGTRYFFDKTGAWMLHDCWVTEAGDVCSADDPNKAYYLDSNGHVADFANQIPVMGASLLSYDAFVNNFSALIADNYPSVYAEKGAATPRDFAAATWTEATAEGVDPVVLAAQIGVETGWLKFGGAVPDWACNFGGIGAVDSAPQNYCIFSSVQEGLLAQAQHLKAYASTEPLNEPCVDPRFDLVKRGIAPYVQDYGNGIWASDPNYASKLVKAMILLGVEGL